MKRSISIFCACAISTMSIIGSLPFNLKIDSGNVKQVNKVAISLDKGDELVGAVKDSYMEENDMKINKSSSDVKKEKVINKALKLSEYTPSVYKDRKYASVPKYQGQLSTCWGFSTIAAVESNLIKKGIVSNEIDLSEAGLIYFTYNKASNSTKDSIINNTGQHYLDLGGNKTMTMYALASGTCLVDEEKLPYEGLSKYTQYDESYCYKSDYIVRDVGVIKANDKDAIKQAVYDYGAVSASLFHDDDMYYNSQNKSYNQNVTNGTNHAVTIIGWDDNYSKDKFNVKPNSDGAWLVKNSWGTSWGDGGYYWVSYEDMSLNNEQYTVAYFNMEEKNDDFLNIYEHDGTYTNGMLHDTRYQGNIFECKEDEALTDVVFFTTQDNISYEINIYTGVNNNPTDGILVHKQSGNVSDAGCHTIKLDDLVNVKEGTKYSVVTKLSTADGGKAIASIDYSSKGNGVEYITVAEKGESFCKEDDGSWQDIGVSIKANCRIKVYTKEIKESEEEQEQEGEQEQEDASCKCTSLTKVNGKEATCTEDGTKAHYACSDCKKIFEDVQGKKELQAADLIIKSANGQHKEVIIPGYEPTCCEFGLSDGKKCSECGDIIEPQKIIEKTKHLLLYVPGKEPTYTYDGYRAYYECFYCRKMFADWCGMIETNNCLIKINKLGVGVTNSIKTKSRKSSSVTFTWDKVKGASGYRVYIAKNGKWVTLKSATTANSYTAKKLLAGTSYKFAVRAYKMVNGKVVWSNSYKTVTIKTLPGYTSKITSKSAGKGKVSLSWNKVKGASGYRLYYKQGKKWVTLKSTMSGNKIKVTGLRAGKKYTFAVRAYAIENGKYVWSDVMASKNVTAPKK